jgi:hypothetical protein
MSSKTLVQAHFSKHAQKLWHSQITLLDKVSHNSYLMPFFPGPVFTRCLLRLFAFCIVMQKYNTPLRHSLVTTHLLFDYTEIFFCHIQSTFATYYHLVITSYPIFIDLSVVELKQGFCVHRRTSLVLYHQTITRDIRWIWGSYLDTGRCINTCSHQFWWTYLLLLNSGHSGSPVVSDGVSSSSWLFRCKHMSLNVIRVGYSELPTCFDTESWTIEVTEVECKYQQINVWKKS